MAKSYVYDYETVKNCFLACFINVKDPNDKLIFEIRESQNETDKYVSFIKDCIKNQNLLISYNGLRFDNQVTQFILQCAQKKQIFFAYDIYKFAQETIRASNAKEFLHFPVNKIKANECDILAINNYDNPAKRCSLKWLQYSMDWHNVEDMSTSHSDQHTEEDIKNLTEYCINDCLSTREMFFRNKAEIKLRWELSKHFNLDLNNASEPKLAKSIFLKLLSEQLNIPENQLKKQRTIRSNIKLKNVILPYINFKTPSLQQTLTEFKSQKLDGENLKGSFKHEVTYKGLEYHFALGGIHGAKKGIYQSCKDNVILSFDVKSYYPNLAIRNGWAPAHLPKELFLKIYEGFYDDRLLYPKSNPLNYVYKILLNATYGLSNDEHSFLKDSLFTMQITCNGQLLLVMLMEELCESIPGARPLMVNTDGGEIILPRKYVDKYFEICKKWETLTKLVLEYEEYHKLIIPDVNNYIGIFAGKEIDKDTALDLHKNQFPKPLIKKTKEGKYKLFNTKTKGRFEVDKPLHKNKSYRVKRIALYNYFVLNQKPEKTIQENQNIFDYCAGVRSKGQWHFEIECLDESKTNLNTTRLPKTLRYFITKKNGCKILKINSDNRIIKVEASSHLEKIMNKYEPAEFDNYNVDIQFYLKGIWKEIHKIEPSNQIMLNFYE
tara:strand:+ start:1689 stop:3677 length:1989 start_codon:yes stop_codon:yes gene_type:complete